MVFYHCLDLKAINMNKLFFKFATFWWFCLLEIPRSDVPAPRVTFRDNARQFVTVLVWDPCNRFETICSIFMSWRDFPGNRKHLFGESKACPLFVYSLYIISEIHWWVQSMSNMYTHATELSVHRLGFFGQMITNVLHTPSGHVPFQNVLKLCDWI